MVIVVLKIDLWPSHFPGEIDIFLLGELLAADDDEATAIDLLSQSIDLR